MSRSLTLLLLLLSALGLLLHSLAFNFVTDDAFISFVYARNLARHGELTFNLGERVEGYTNFLWTLLIALGLRLQVPAELSARVLGTFCGALSFGACALGMRRLRAAASWSPWDAVPALLLCLVPGYACWSSGGLETQLFTFLVTLAAVLLFMDRDRLGAAGLCFGLAALTRPEGILFFGLSGLYLLVAGWRRDGLRGPRRSRGYARFLLLFLVLVVPHFLWRRHYYGWWLPNTFYIKTSSMQGAWRQGGYYLLLLCREQKLFLLPLLGLLALRRQPAFVGYTLLVSAVFLGYVVSVGGDFMGLHRFVMPIVPLNAIAAALGLERLLHRLRPRTQAAAVALLLLVHGLNTYYTDRHALGFIGADRGIDTPGYLRHYTADRAAIGKWLGQNVRPDDYQAVGGAGAQVYYAGIRALDSFGLSDAYVAHQVAAVSNRPGHQKFAPLDYVLSRRPTIITYNVYRIEDRPYHPTPEEGRFWRERGFHFVSVQVAGLSRPWYTFLKRLDRRLGPLPKADDID